MKKTIRYSLYIALVIATFLVIGRFKTTAQTPEELFEQQKEASGATLWWEQMPQEIKNSLASLGITGIDVESIITLQPESVGETVWTAVLRESAPPLRMGGVLLAVLMLCSFGEGLRTLGDRSEVSAIFQLVAGLAVCGTVVLPLLSCIRRAADAVEGCMVLMNSFVPVYAAVLSASGHVTSALSYQSVVLWVGELLTVLIDQWITPLLTVALGLGIVGNVGVPWKLSTLCDAFHKGCSWFLGLTGTVFTGMLSVQSFVGAATDTLSVKAIRFSVANLVPVVGGSIGEALNTVRGCLTLLKTTLGGVGILATAVLLVPPLLSCVCWIAVIALCAAAADMLAVRSAGDMLRTVLGTVKTLVAVLSVCGLFLIVATAIVSRAGGG